MTLNQIIAGLLLQPGRTSVELPRGLWLVHYPAENDQSARLVVGRYLSQPSERELAIVRARLLDVLDSNQSRVAYDITPWIKVENNDWHGFSISWHTLAVTDAFHPDPECATLVRVVLERRKERIAERRKKELNRKPRRRSATKPML